MEPNYLMKLKPCSLNTLGPTYSNLPETYMYKRAIVNATDIPTEDKMKQYKEDITTALNSNNVITLHYPFLEYNIISKTIGCIINEISNAISYTLEQIELIDVDTQIRTTLQADIVTCEYNKKKGTIVIKIPDFNEKKNIFSANLISIIDPNLSVMCTLLYKP